MRPQDLRSDPGTALRRFVEAEQLEPAQALLRGAIHDGVGAGEVRSWLTGVVSDHLLSYGHAAIYSQKAFQLLDLLGWERADTVLPHLLPTIVTGTRMDTLPYMRMFTRALAGVDLDALAALEVDGTWRDDGTLSAAILGATTARGRAAPLTAAVAALRDGAGIDGVLDVVVDTVSERMLRYDPRGEFDEHDDFGWLDITHGLTYANAVRWHAAGSPGPDAVRLALWCVFLAHWTGRHEWHTSVPEPDEVDLGIDGGTDDLVVAAESLQRQSLGDRTSTFIVHAHGIKTSRAAALEAVASGSPKPLQAVSRFLEAPKLERFVAANVTRSIDFVSGRTHRAAD